MILVCIKVFLPPHVVLVRETVTIIIHRVCFREIINTWFDSNKAHVASPLLTGVSARNF